MIESLPIPMDTDRNRIYSQVSLMALDTASKRKATVIDESDEEGKFQAVLAGLSRY